MKKRILLLLCLFSCLLFAGQRSANTEQESFSARTAGLRKLDGFMPLYWDERSGKMWLEISRFNQEFLYVTALSAGVGSNELGLDRGNTNPPVIVQFERSGPRVLLIESNYRFRAMNNNPAEKRATEDSFARSTLWGFDVASEEGGRVLVDATNFFLRDAAHVAERIQRQRQGQYRLDPTRSDFYLAYTKAFPRNTEIETTITFTGEPTGNLVREVTPSPDAIPCVSINPLSLSPSPATLRACKIPGLATSQPTSWISPRPSINPL